MVEKLIVLTMETKDNFVCLKKLQSIFSHLNSCLEKGINWLAVSDTAV